MHALNLCFQASGARRGFFAWQTLHVNEHTRALTLHGCMLISVEGEVQQLPATLISVRQGLPLLT